MMIYSILNNDNGETVMMSRIMDDGEINNDGKNNDCGIIVII